MLSVFLPLPLLLLGLLGAGDSGAAVSAAAAADDDDLVEDLLLPTALGGTVSRPAVLPVLLLSEALSSGIAVATAADLLRDLFVFTAAGEVASGGFKPAVTLSVVLASSPAGTGPPSARPRPGLLTAS
jgi:hypothetical protein